MSRLLWKPRIWPTVQTVLHHYPITMEPVKRQGIQIVSDTHLEFRAKTNAPIIQRHAPNLALLGDIGKPFSQSYEAFIGEQARTFDNVFVVMGNHEYYNHVHTQDVILEKARQVCSQWGNVHHLERETVDLTEQTTILGCTLWSPLNALSSTFLNDMNMIRIKDVEGKKRTLDITTYLSWHFRDVQWLALELKRTAERGRKAIVLTHHGPCLDMSGKFKGNKFNSAFVSDLKHLFVPPTTAFASGHVHSNVDVNINGIRSVSNALGYPGEDTGYKDDVIVDIL